MKFAVKTTLVALAVFSASAVMAGPHHMMGPEGHGYCDGPYMEEGYGPRGEGCMYRRHNGACFSFNPEQYRNDPQFAKDYEKIHELKDDVFVQRQVLKSVVNSGADEATVRAAAEKFLKVRDDFRNAKNALFDKIYRMETSR